MVFLILCIGADDVFVYTDTWKASAAMPPHISGSYYTRFAWTWAKAAGTMFATTLTTCICLGLTALSTIPTVRSFGLFGSFLVLVRSPARTHTQCPVCVCVEVATDGRVPCVCVCVRVAGGLHTSDHLVRRSSSAHTVPAPPSIVHSMPLSDTAAVPLCVCVCCCRYPAVVLWHDKHWCFATGHTCGRKKPEDGQPRKPQLIARWMRDTIAPLLFKLRWACLLVSIAFAAGGVYLRITMFEPASRCTRARARARARVCVCVCAAPLLSIFFSHRLPLPPTTHPHKQHTPLQA